MVMVRGVCVCACVCRAREVRCPLNGFHSDLDRGLPNDFKMSLSRRGTRSA